MKYKSSHLVFSILMLSLLACSPRRIVYKVNDQYHPQESYHPFALIEIGQDFDDSDAIRLGEVQIKDNVLAFRCDYETIRNMAIDEAKFMGGNCIRVIDHKPPSHWGSCHKITAEVFYLSNPEEYEAEIFWHKNRKLAISDFKGSAKNKPYVAMTSGMIRYYIMGRSNVHVNIETVFDCNTSYFKQTEDNENTLTHEQIHFDIAELYARKFAQRLQHQINSYQTLLAKHESIYMEVFKELQKKQGEFDSEVYDNPDLQVKWEIWIEKELERFQDYERKQFEILL